MGIRHRVTILSLKIKAPKSNKHEGTQKKTQPGEADNIQQTHKEQGTTLKPQRPSWRFCDQQILETYVMETTQLPIIPLTPQDYTERRVRCE